MTMHPIPEGELDTYDLTRELDKVKSEVFLDKYNASFLGSLMCSLNFVWTRDIETSATDGVNIYWNPERFLGLPFKSRVTDLAHELWHVALLHMVRRGSRDPGDWNIACDIRIDLLLEEQGKTFEGIGGVDRDPKYRGWVEEDIYEDLRKDPNNKPKSCTCSSHKIEVAPHSQQSVINNVVQSIHQAKLAGQAGNLPMAVEETIKKFLEPVIPWETVLMQFFTDLLNTSYSWKRPNRRYQDLYLPSRIDDDGRLEHLMYFLDVSGSVTEAQVLRFNSEVKYIQEVLKPQRLTLVQFHDTICHVKEFMEDEPFDEITIFERGGTLYQPIREYVEKHRPTAAVIFTDMGFFDRITKPNYDVPVIWVATGNKRATAPFGKLIHID